MQVSVEAKGKLEREMRVEIPEERIASEVQNRLQSLSRTTKIQGFRPGKAPFKVVQQRYGKQVRQEVIGEVLQSTFYEAINQENLRPAGLHVLDAQPVVEMRRRRSEEARAVRGDGLDAVLDRDHVVFGRAMVAQQFEPFAVEHMGMDVDDGH